MIGRILCSAAGCVCLTLAACGAASPPSGRIVATVAVGSATTPIASAASASAGDQGQGIEQPSVTSGASLSQVAASVTPAPLPTSTLTQVPTATPVPAPPTPTADPNTKTGAVLDFNQTWLQGTVQLTLRDLQFGDDNHFGCANSLASFHVVINNAGSGVLFPTVDSTQWSAFDNTGKKFALQGRMGCPPDALQVTPAIKPGDKYDGEVWVAGKLSDLSRSTALHVLIQKALAAIPAAEWQVQIPH